MPYAGSERGGDIWQRAKDGARGYDQLSEAMVDGAEPNYDGQSAEFRWENIIVLKHPHNASKLNSALDNLFDNI